MKNIIITGGTGNIGRVLTALLLEKGYRVTVFTRNPNKYTATSTLKYSYWNPYSGDYDAAAIAETDGIIGLAGAGIADKRWTKKRKKEIYNSRIKSAELILEAMKRTANHVEVVVNASATGFYGMNAAVSLKEDDAPGKGFLAEVCRDWENKNRFIAYLDKRNVILRTGVVLDKNSGAYPKMTSSLKLGIGVVIGSGSQMMSWIHIDDLCRLYVRALEDPTFSGVYNACSPTPVTVSDLIHVAADAKKKKILFEMKIPAFVIRNVVGELADEALLQSSNVNVEKLLQTGFQFKYPTIADAANAIENDALNQSWLEE